jgi:hypothetical protein
MVQTEERMCLYRMRLERRRLLAGEPRIQFHDQSEWTGRLKMFGPPSRELLELVASRQKKEER